MLFINYFLSNADFSSGVIIDLLYQSSLAPDSRFEIGDVVLLILYVFALVMLYI
jgi:hypothetical protein